MYRLGGWIQTTRSDDGFTFEHGPRTVRPAGPKGANTLELIEDLGIEDKIVPIKYGHPATVNRMVCVNGELHKLPSNLKGIFTTQPPFSKPLFLAGVKEFFTTQKKCPDESIYDFVQRRFGSVNVTSAVNFSRIKLHNFTHKDLASITYIYSDSKISVCSLRKPKTEINLIGFWSSYFRSVMKFILTFLLRRKK